MGEAYYINFANLVWTCQTLINISETSNRNLMKFRNLLTNETAKLLSLEVLKNVNN